MISVLGNSSYINIQNEKKNPNEKNPKTQKTNQNENCTLFSKINPIKLKHRFYYHTLGSTITQYSPREIKRMILLTHVLTTL